MAMIRLVERAEGIAPYEIARGGERVGTAVPNKAPGFYGVHVELDGGRRTYEHATNYRAAVKKIRRAASKAPCG